MPRYYTADYECTDCKHRWYETVEFETRDLLRICPKCKNEKGERIMSAPKILTASWPDGYRRQNDENWKRFSEESDLEIKQLDAKPEEKKVIQKEIDKVKGV